MELRHSVKGTLNGAEQLHEQVDELVRALVRAANESGAAAGGDQRVKRITVEVNENQAWQTMQASSTAYVSHEYELELVTELL